jgi:hypothetical protein
MKVFFYLNLFLSLVFLSSCVQGQTDTQESVEVQILENDSLPIFERMNQKAISLKRYLNIHSTYNQNLIVLIDMRQNSGKYRLFVYDLDSMKVISKALVAHGSGSETDYVDSLKFSNVPNSYCTSIGKYKIGASYIGSFGKSYKLHGLDDSNNKAFERFVVLHRYSCVPDSEQSHPICNSLGCPMVSENYFLQLDKYISKSNKPILLEIYY